MHFAGWGVTVPVPFFRWLILFFLPVTLLLPDTAFCEPEPDAPDSETTGIRSPLDMETLRAELSHVRGNTVSTGSWPRRVFYDQSVYDPDRNAFKYGVRIVEIPDTPVRIFPHSTGVAEILWAICPRKRIIGFRDVTANPEYSVIAEEIRNQYPLFTPRRTKELIRLRPDLVFTVYYSSPEFRNTMKEVGIPVMDLGHFGSFASIRKQIVIIGNAIGEGGNAAALVKRMDGKLAELQQRLPSPEIPPRLLCYNRGGYVTGRTTSFDAVCNMIGAVNVAAEQGVVSVSRIEPETLLQWNPDVIVVPAESGLKERIGKSDEFAVAAAVRNDSVHTLPAALLSADSQFMLLTANLLAGLVYEGSF